MGIFNFWNKNRSTTAANQTAPMVSRLDMDFDMMYSARDPLTLPVVMASVSMIAEDTARVPLKVYKKSDVGRIEITNHPVCKLLQEQPNDYMDAYEMRKAVQMNMLLWGNGYIYIRRDVQGRAVELMPITSSQVQRLITETQDFYRLSNGQIIVPQDMVHLKRATIDGITGLSMISLMARTLAIAQMGETYANSLLNNQAMMGTVLRLKEGSKINQEEKAKQSERFASQFSGAYKAGKTVLLPEHIDVVSVPMPSHDIQLIETRKYQKRDWAMVLRVPLHMLADLEKSSFSNIEQQSLEYVKYAIAPHLHTWEMQLRNKLFSDVERSEGVYVEHNAEGLLRGDIAARTAHYTSMHTNGLMSANEIRAKENLDPLPSGGDIFYTPAGAVPIGYYKEDKGEVEKVNEE